MCRWQGKAASMHSCRHAFDIPSVHPACTELFQCSSVYFRTLKILFFCVLGRLVKTRRGKTSVEICVGPQEICVRSFRYKENGRKICVVKLDHILILGAQSFLYLFLSVLLESWFYSLCFYTLYRLAPTEYLSLDLLS